MATKPSVIIPGVGSAQGYTTQADGTLALDVNMVGSAASSVGTDRSIVATTTSQTLMPANTTRRKFFVRNDTAIDVWINFGAAASSTAGGGNLKVAAGGYFELDGSTSSVTIIAASGTPAITAREY